VFQQVFADWSASAAAQIENASFRWRTVQKPIEPRSSFQDVRERSAM
jgi:hypothetical protein